MSISLYKLQTEAEGSYPDFDATEIQKLVAAVRAAMEYRAQVEGYPMSPGGARIRAREAARKALDAALAEFVP